MQSKRGTVPAPNLEEEWSNAKSCIIFSIQFIDFNTSCLYCFSLPLFCCILDLDSRPGRPVLIIIVLLLSCIFESRPQNAWKNEENKILLYTYNIATSLCANHLYFFNSSDNPHYGSACWS